MSNYEQRDMTGRLFRNEEKKNPNGPDYSGTCMINGVEMFFDGWLKTAESGRKWMSFSFKAKEKQAKAAETPPRRFPPKSEPSDDIPW
jgi:uncharacterized protein (DUF736 family)